MKTFWLIVYYGLAKHLPKSTIPVLGPVARALRGQCARHLFATCKAEVNLEQGAAFGNGNDIYVLGSVGIGKNFICHQRVVTFLGELMMGEDVLFQGGGHSFADPNMPIGSEPGEGKTPLEIDHDVWIGSRVIIAPGCKRIGAHSIIGIGSVVTHDVPDYAIVAGNPAKIIRMRK